MDRCPEMKTKLIGDEHYDICQENDRLCILWSVDTCDTFEKIKKEDSNEN